MLNRRGFLKSLAAAVGAPAVFDVASKLWLPSTVNASFATAPLVEIAHPVDIGLQVELNAWAAQFARALGHLLKTSKGFALSEVLYEHAGIVHGRPMELVVDGGIGPGRFIPLGPRLLFPSIVEGDKTRWIERSARQLRDRFDRYSGGVDAYAPITADLRPGVSFSSDVMIGVGRDEETGLSARVLRWPHEGGTIYHGFEVAGGSWRRVFSPAEAQERARTYYREYGDPWSDRDDEDAYVGAHAGDFEVED